MQTVLYDTIYEMSLAGMKIPHFSDEEICKMCENGSFMSHITEGLGAKAFNIKLRNGKGYDYPIQEGVLKQIDNKNFTKRGLKFMPSNMIGEGRSFDKEKFEEHTSKTDYMVVDIVSFPYIRIVLKRGTELARDYPNGVVTLARIEEIFKPEYKRVVVNEKEVNPKRNERKEEGEKYLPGSILHEQECGTKDDSSCRSEIQLSLF